MPTYRMLSKEDAKQIRQDLDILEFGQEKAFAMKSERARVEFGLKKAELEAAMSADKANQIKKAMHNLITEFNKHTSVLLEESGLADILGNLGNFDKNAYERVQNNFIKADPKQLIQRGEELLAFVGEKLEKVGVAEKIGSTYLVTKSVPDGGEDLVYFYNTALENLRGIAAPMPVVRAQRRLDEAIQNLVDVAQADFKKFADDIDEMDDFLRMDITKMSPEGAVIQANDVLKYIEENVTNYYDVVKGPDGRDYAKIKEEYLDLINSYRQALIAFLDLSDFVA